MSKEKLNEDQIRTKLKDYCDNSTQCGLEAFIVYLNCKKEFS